MGTFSEPDTEAFRAELRQFILEELDAANNARDDNPKEGKFVDESCFAFAEFHRAMMADIPFPIDEPDGPQLTLVTLCYILEQLGYSLLEAADARIAITKNFIRLLRSLETEPITHHREIENNWLFSLILSKDQLALAQTFVCSVPSLKCPSVCAH